MGRFVEIDGRRVDFLALTIQSIVLFVYVFVSVMTGTGMFGGVNWKAAAAAAALAALGKVSAYLLSRLGIDEEGKNR